MYSRHFHLPLLRRFSSARIDKLRAKEPISETTNLFVRLSIDIARLNVMIELQRTIIIKGLDPLLRTSRLNHPALKVNQHETIRTRIISVPHEDMIYFIIHDLLSSRVPENTWV